MHTYRSLSSYLTVGFLGKFMAQVGTDILFLRAAVQQRTEGFVGV